jgi:MATE family multidrug resistance protein
VRWPILTNAVGFWGIGFPLGVVLMHEAGLGPPGMWWGLTAGLVSVAILLLFRLRWLARRGVRRLSVEGRAPLADQASGGIGPSAG